MILKKVKIYNYRQLQKVELDLQNSLTVLAGPNNSGKTTLISVLKGMFRDKKLSFTYSDIPTNLSTSWVEKIIPVFQSIMVENDKNTGISEIIKKIDFHRFRDSRISNARNRNSLKRFYEQKNATLDFHLRWRFSVRIRAKPLRRSRR